MEADSPAAFEPDRSLEDRIGKHTDLNMVFTPERIAASQNVIDSSKLSFFTDAQDDMALLDQFIRAAQTAPDNAPHLEAIIHHAHNIASQAQLLGLPFIASLSTYVVTYAENKVLPLAVRLPVLAKIFQALQIAMKEKMTNEGGSIGREIQSYLQTHTSPSA